MNSLLIAQNIILRSLRNKKELALLLILPILGVLLLTFQVNQVADTIISVGLVMQDEDIAAQKFVEMLDRQQDFKFMPLTTDTYQEALLAQEVKMVILLPEQLSSKALQGQKAEVRLFGEEIQLFTSSLSQLTNEALLNIYAAAELANNAALQQDISPQQALEVMLADTTAPPLSVDYQMPGQDNGRQFGEISSAIGFTIMFIMTLIFLVIGTIMEDRKNLVLARMSVAPIHEWEIVVGNLLGSLCLGLIQLIPLVLVLRSVLGLTWGAQFWQLFLVFFCFLLATIGLGIGISGIIGPKISPTNIIATVIVPTCILGGCFIPASMMPDILNKIGYVVPQHWVMAAIEQVVVGSDFSAILLNIAVIIMFGIAFATFGIKTLKPLDS